MLYQLELELEGNHPLFYGMNSLFPIGKMLFFGFYWKPVIQTIFHVLEYTRDFLIRLSYLQDIPENSILVSSDVVGIYPNMPHEEGIDVSMWTVCGCHYMVITFTRFNQY